MPHTKTIEPKRRAHHLFSALLISFFAFGIFHTFIGAPKVNAATTELAASTQLTPEEQSAAKNQMSTWKAMVLGAVEGVTEYLPISSTGHLVVTQRILGIGDTDATKDAADSYAIAIQFGAILAVLVLYRKRIESIIRGLFGRDTDGRNLLVSLVIAFIPAVVIGVAIEKPIKSDLLNVGPVVGAWIVGGLLILFLAPKIKADRPGMSITHIRPKQALIIGCAQVLAMWPGTSRSLVTILAALAVGTTLAAAVEFSFLLGLMTLGAATLYETTKNGSTVIDAYGWFNPLVGLVFAFIFAALAVKWMVSWLQTRSLAVFGWERLVVAAASIGLMIAGTI
ncbi:MAG: undecaprenyl-diphosphate phosphatase [Actinobacteria bacterium]|nr:undecaprenyl-diphosphate phosphatase [Actinomycetota bacterium]